MLKEENILLKEGENQNNVKEREKKRGVRRLVTQG